MWCSYCGALVVAVHVRVNFWEEAFLSMHKYQLIVHFFTTEDTQHLCNVMIWAVNTYVKYMTFNS
jgi:hypothetical protein